MQFPLLLEFKIIAVARQIWVRDATGQLICYVKQKAFKLKEAVTVYADEAQTQPVFQIQADRILDISASYTIADMAGNVMGALQRRGMRSLWRAHYEVVRGGVTLFTVREENPWAKVADNFLGEIPLLGLLSGYLFHPSYAMTRMGGAPVLRVVKQPAFLQGRFTIERTGELSQSEEPLAVLGVLMMVLLERSRG